MFLALWRDPAGTLERDGRLRTSLVIAVHVAALEVLGAAGDRDVLRRRLASVHGALTVVSDDGAAPSWGAATAGR